VKLNGLADGLNLTPDHPGGHAAWLELASQSMGTTNEGAARWLLDNLFNSMDSKAQSKTAVEQELNGALSMLQEIAPRDEIEAMLISQMIATHALIAIQARRLHSATAIPQLEANGSMLTKLQRTFTTQLEALQRYRGKASQQVRVEHVHVHQGGQAIVGAVQAGGGDPLKVGEQPNALGNASGEALRSEIEADRQAVSISSR
jgi:hypothetical protein